MFAGQYNCEGSGDPVETMRSRARYMRERARDLEKIADFLQGCDLKSETGRLVANTILQSVVGIQNQ